MKPEAAKVHPSDHIDFLDHIRGIAILFVFIFHALGATFGRDKLNWSGWFRDFHEPISYLLLLPVNIGEAGVAIFFAVSGFCIHLSYQRAQKHGFKEFFWRRFFRIYPPYLLALLFFAFIDTATRVDIETAVGWRQVWSHLLLVHNLVDYRCLTGINGAFWSIGVEVQLYVIYPVLLWIVKRFGWGKALLVTGIIEMGMRTVCGVYDVMPNNPLPVWFRFSPFFFWFSWSIGAAVADDLLHGRPILLGRFPAWVWLALAVVCWFVKPLFVFTFPLMALASTNVISTLLTKPRPRLNIPPFVMNQIRLAGVMSYSIYLLHQPFLGRVSSTIVRHLAPHLPLLAEYGLCMLFWWVILIPSWFLYKYVELPSIEFGKKFCKKRRVVIEKQPAALRG